MTLTAEILAMTDSVGRGTNACSRPGCPCAGRLRELHALNDKACRDALAAAAERALVCQAEGHVLPAELPLWWESRRVHCVRCAAVLP